MLNNPRDYSVISGPGKTRPWSGAPLGHLDVEITERCDNDCLHCSINHTLDDSRAISREINTEDCRGILRQAAELGAISVRFTGGEPLVRDDFPELYLFARNLGMKVILFTNARKLNSNLADLLARTPPLEKIEVSVYGLHRTSYEAVTRVPGSYREFRRGLDLLIQKKIPFTVKGAVLPPNKTEIRDFDAWASTLPGMTEHPSYSMFFGLRDRRDSEMKNRTIASLRLSPEEGLRILSRNGREYERTSISFCERHLGPPGPKLFSCGAGLGGCVDAYGRLQPCLSLRAPQTGYDLKTGTMRDALTVFFPKLRQIEAEHPDYLKRCAKCFIKGLCEQCPAKSWAEHGQLDSPVDYFCRIAHAQARQLGLIGETENAWEVILWKQRIDDMKRNNHEHD